MAERLVVLIENDPVLSERLRAVLAAYHLRVELIHDGNELSLRRDLEPALIILCIDPKRLGWAICNKIKKAPQYRGVPMIVTSQEATDKDFEDHKKLRTRAEEYLHKPFGVETLLEKVAALIGLDPPQLDESALEEIPIDDASLIEEEILDVAQPATLVGTRGQMAQADPPVPLTLDQTHLSEDHLSPYIDQQIADETDAAFAAIGVSEPRRSKTPMGAQPAVRHDTQPPRRGSLPGLPGVSASGGRSFEDEIELGFEDVVTTGVRRSAQLRAEAELAEQRQELESAVAQAQGETDQARRLAEQAQADADRWHDERDYLASQRDGLAAERDRLMKERDRLEQEHRQAIAERDRLTPERDGSQGDSPQDLVQLRDERDRYKAEADELRIRPSHPPASGATNFSRERDFLNLREVINKKDKEVLDLRDALDSKERQILDSRDKARELERMRRDLDERLLEIEREYVAAREKLEALGHDKEKSLEREKGLKVRLDDAQRKLGRADEEIDGWKKRYASDLMRAEEALGLARAQHEKDAQELAATHAGQVEALNSEHAANVQGLLGEHAGQMQVLREEHGAEQTKLVGQHAALVRSMRDEHGEAEARAQATHAAVLRREREEREAERLGLVERHAAAIADLDAQKEAAIAELEEQRRAVVADLTAQHESATADQARRYDEALAAERHEHADRLAQKEAQQKRELADQVRARETQVAELGARHRQELEAAETRRSQEQENAERALAQAEKRRLQELAERTRQHEAEGEIQREEHAAAVEKLGGEHRRHMDEQQQQRDALSAQHHREMDELTQVLTSERDSVAERLGERETDLSHTRTQLAETEATLAGLRQRYGDLSEQIDRAHEEVEERNQRISALENENAAFQEQILRAYQRIKSDEGLVSRAKKALAIALTLLDESGAPVLPTSATSDELRRED